MISKVARSIAILVVVLLLALPASSLEVAAWGNGSSTSAEWPNFGIHDITTDIAQRTASLTAAELLTWLNDWYMRNATDYGYSFDPASTRPTQTDNINAYTDDPDSYWQDWDNHTIYIHRRSSWDPPEGDAAIRTSQLYNMTRNHLYGWLMNGSVRYDPDQHAAAYYAGLMAHYVMDITQFGHTEWTRLDHSYPVDDPVGATYHSYYEARSWSNRALRTIHVDLMMQDLQELERVNDPAQVVQDLAAFVNGRHGPDVQYQDADSTIVTLGSTYVKMLELFVTDYDANNIYNGARGYSEELWNLTLENLWAGMNNLSSLWTSAFLDARDMFRADAPDVVVEQILLDPVEGAYEGLEVNVTVRVRNVGNASTGDLNVALFIDNESVSEARTDLEAGQMVPIDFVWTAEAGEHEVRVVADVYHQVPEANETNNVGWKMYTVAEAHHGSRLVADKTTLTLLQDASGTFNLTLTNIGNKEDTYRIYLDTYPGAIDFSMTLLVAEQLTIPPGGQETFTIDVTTLLDNPVGPRFFRVIADGGNSTGQVELAVVIEERNVAPYIDVEYVFYGNVSVPMTFDASATWDRNGDNISFVWRIDGINVATGPVLDWVFMEEGDYIINLMAHDGTNERWETLEVSIQDAIPPAPVIQLLDVDIDAAIVKWSIWDSPKYFHAYRFYAGVEPDPDLIVREENLVATVDLVYVKNATLLFDLARWGNETYVAMEIVNIYNHSVRSNVLHVVPEINTPDYNTDHYELDWPFNPLEWSWVSQTDSSKYNITVMWREWVPLGRGGTYHLFLYWRDPVTSGYLNLSIDDLSINNHTFNGFAPSFGSAFEIRYVDPTGSSYVRYSTSVWTLGNSLPSVNVPKWTEGIGGEELEFMAQVHDEDGTIERVIVDWEDGTNDTLDMPTKGILSFSHVYGSAGNYDVRVMVKDSDGDWTNVTTLFIVTEEEASGGTFGNTVIAIALIIFVALLGVIAGHLTGYYRIGREHEGKEEAEESVTEPVEEEEPEQTAEEIISELEEDLGDEEDREYFDHEPSVAELEELIPKDNE
jgi:hypothetical protein